MNKSKGIFIYSNLFKNLTITEAVLMSHIVYLDLNFKTVHFNIRYYSNLLNMTERSIYNLLNVLTEKKFILIELASNNKKEIIVTEKTKNILSDMYFNPNKNENKNPRNDILTEFKKLWN